MEAFFSYYLAATVFVFGAIIGSFLNVVIYRFHTGKSLNGSSHCLSCLQPLLWYELFPLLSYLCLRGRCRTCQAYIPPRYFVVELLTACTFLQLYYLMEPLVATFLLAIIAAILIVIAVYDVYHFIIPNELVLLLSFGVAAYVGYDVVESGEWTALLPASLSALGAFLFYAGLWKVSEGRWIGFGDAKLAIPLGFFASFPAVFSTIVLSFWVGAAVSVSLLLVQKLLERGQRPLQFFGTPLTMKSEIPFAPFLIIGFILSTIYGVDVLELIAYVM